MPDTEQSAPPEQRNREGFGAPPEEDVIPQPIGLWYAFLVGGALTTLGILGFIPAFTQGGALFDIIRVTPATNFLHLFTGLAGIGVAFLGKRRYATIYCATIGAIYVITFSNGNVDYGNLAGTFGPHDLMRRIQWITFNGIHAGIMLTAWLVAGLSALQKGDRATREYRRERLWFLQSRTRTEA